MGGQHRYLVVHVGVGDEDVSQLVGVDPPVPHPVALQLTVSLQRCLPLQVHGDFVVRVHQSEIIIIIVIFGERQSVICKTCFFS